LKVLVVSNFYPPDVEGGYERGCAQVVSSLRQAGHEVLVLTSVPRRPAAPETDVFRRLHLSDVYDPVLNRPRDASGWARLSVAAEWIDAANVYRLLDEIERTRPEVVYVWNVEGLGGLGVLISLQLLGIPWVMHLMDPVPGIIAALRGPRFSQLQGLFKSPIQGRYISCSQHVIDEIGRNGVELGGAVDLIPNWVVGPRPAHIPRARHGPLRILMASVVTRFKGVDVMMEAAALLRRRGVRDFTVDVYGTVLDPSLYATRAELDLADTFILKGEVPQVELMERYAEYDLFAFPTWAREAFGFTGLEAASRGCAVLMTATCGLAEWLVDGVHCLKAERTPEAFADVIERVIRGEIDPAPIAARAQKVVLRDFHLDTLLPRIEAVLADAADNPPSGGRPADQVYRTARLAENLASAIIDEAVKPGS